MVILFIVAGTAKLGYGHLVRAHYLADQLNSFGHECILATEENSRPESLKISPFKQWLIMPSPSCFSENLLFLSFKVSEIKPNICILDHYGYKDEHRDSLFNLCENWVHFVSTSDKLLSASLNISSNPSLDRAKFEVDPMIHQKFLFGTKYAVLSNEFACDTNIDCKHENQMLVSMGGGDDLGLSEKLCNILCAHYTDYKIVVVVGPSNPNLAKIEALYSFYANNLEVCPNPSDISTVFKKSSLAIIAGGTTFFELAACYVPMIAIPIAENQISQAKALKHLSALKLIYKEKVSPDLLIREVDDILFSVANRDSLVKHARALVSTNAATTIAAQITNHFSDA